ncbi:hypothetical protein D9M73_214940 [compost metagenome]|jgi:hypothetical protein
MLMSDYFTEEEMRRALFGGETQVSSAIVNPKATSTNPTKKRVASFASKIRVTLHVTNVYEGEVEIVTFDSPSLSRLVAEMDAKRKFQKNYRYVEVVKVDRI